MTARKIPACVTAGGVRSFRPRSKFASRSWKYSAHPCTFPENNQRDDGWNSGVFKPPPFPASRPDMKTLENVPQFLHHNTSCSSRSSSRVAASPARQSAATQTKAKQTRLTSVNHGGAMFFVCQTHTQIYIILPACVRPTLAARDQIQFSR